MKNRLQLLCYAVISIFFLSFFSPFAAANEFLGVYCIDIQNETDNWTAFEVAVTQISPGYLIVDGRCHQLDETPNSAVSGSAFLIDQGNLQMTLRVAQREASGIRPSLYHLHLAPYRGTLFAGTYQRLSNDPASGSMVNTSGTAALDLCSNPPADHQAIDNDGDGFSENQGDCNDADPSVYPDAAEICGDGIDQDCSGADQACPQGDQYDNDSDGYSENQGDCNDADPTVYPGAAEICGDGIDQDCSGDDLACPSGDDIDNDNDGVTEEQGDCDDTDPNVYPGATEIPGDGIDQDCNPSTWPIDSDRDGDGLTELQGDCDDTRANVHPGAVDTPFHLIDVDCDPTTYPKANQ